MTTTLPTTDGIDLVALSAALTAACEHYEKSAPTVEQHCDDLYIRLDDLPDKVSVAEVCQVARLWQDGGWMQPNLAANLIYKLRHRLGMTTTGQAGF